MWLGEQITSNGVGNGISIIIFAGIVASIPKTVGQIYETQFVGSSDQLFIHIVKIALLAIAILAVIVGVIFIQQAVRKIAIQYAKGQGRSPAGGGQSTHLPLKVNPAGVIPVIFAVAFLITPRTIASFFGTNDVTKWIQANFDNTHPVGMTVYVALIIAFTYFYAFVQVNPEQMADNLKNRVAISRGSSRKMTQDRITSILYRLTFVGSIFLAVISILPIFSFNSLDCLKVHRLAEHLC